MDKALNLPEIKALRMPIVFVGILWAIHLSFYFEKINAFDWGVYPLKLKGLPGIITAPFIHEGFHHLFNNSIPLLVLGWATIYFYKEVAYKVFAFIWLVGGLWLWLVGRPAYHLGASGLVYGLVAFLLLSGILRREARVAGISLLVIFLYGSLVWGLFPIDYKISFEAHFCGTLAGLAMAILYRHTGIQRQEFVWPEDDENEEGVNFTEDMNSEGVNPQQRIN
jgi:membrane associated rhomboid family serine protease